MHLCEIILGLTGGFPEKGDDTNPVRSVCVCMFTVKGMMF